jgi:Protein of unknown function (DUF2637)
MTTTPTPVLSDQPADGTEPDAASAQHARRLWVDVDQAVRIASAAGAIAMYCYGAVLSYAVLFSIALAAGLHDWLAAIWPLGWEAFMAIAAVNAWADRRASRPSGYALTLTAATVAGSFALNISHPFIPLDPPPWWLVALVYGLPPVTAALAWHLFLMRIGSGATHGAESAATGGAEGQDMTAAVDSLIEDREPPAPDSAPRQDGATHEHDGSRAVLPRRNGARQDEASRAAVRVLLANETQDKPVSWQDVQAATGRSRSRSYALLREERDRLPSAHQAREGRDER